MHRCHQNGTVSHHPACISFSLEFCSIHATCVLLVPLSVSLTLIILFLRCSFLLYFKNIQMCVVFNTIPVACQIPQRYTFDGLPEKYGKRISLYLTQSLSKHDSLFRYMRERKQERERARENHIFKLLWQ